VGYMGWLRGPLESSEGRSQYRLDEMVVAAPPAPLVEESLLACSWCFFLRMRAARGILRQRPAGDLDPNVMDLTKANWVHICPGSPIYAL
jgi:hypothetical protein